MELTREMALAIESYLEADAKEAANDRTWAEIGITAIGEMRAHVRARRTAELAALAVKLADLEAPGSLGEACRRYRDSLDEISLKHARHQVRDIRMLVAANDEQHHATALAGVAQEVWRYRISPLKEASGLARLHDLLLPLGHLEPEGWELSGQNVRTASGGAIAGAAETYEHEPDPGYEGEYYTSTEVSLLDPAVADFLAGAPAALIAHADLERRRALGLDSQDLEL